MTTAIPVQQHIAKPEELCRAHGWEGEDLLGFLRVARSVRQDARTKIIMAAITAIEDLPFWLADDGYRVLRASVVEALRRLLRDMEE